MRKLTTKLTWLKALLEELGIKPSTPIPMHYDNEAAIHIATNSVFHERTKHIELDCHKVREKIEEGVTLPYHTPSVDQLADIFTKAVCQCGNNVNEEYEFWVRLGEAGGFDIEHLIDTKPPSCLVGCRKFDKNDDYTADIVLFARMGIHRYNMIQGTNLQFSYIEKYNYRPSRVYTAYYLTLVAKDPDAGNSLLTFQTRVVDEDFDIKKLSCSIAGPKTEAQGNPLRRQNLDPEPVDDFYKGRLPEWPLSENAFYDKKRFHLLKKSELRKYDWIRLYMELAFLFSNLWRPKNPKLSNLVIVMVAIETKDNVEPSSERLKAKNANFYIKYKYYPSKARPPKVRPAHRIAIVRRTFNKNTGHLTLQFDGQYAKTFLKNGSGP
ncbi:PREDICTED: UPF0725 protein At3g19520-like [Camelina sativa]|uniref:UPF0725 protein At3g19520-like n=1 Tax=Camelina sativa TaxID=90675 RepID=A0ABM0SLH3_CAMSA|nr:PREDICTED: UPF0725 protein At3g19520-like [Camelina sativa]